MMNEQDKAVEQPICRSHLALRPILYTDTIGGNQVCRDDMWAVTTDELSAIQSAPIAPVQAASPVAQPQPISDQNARFAIDGAIEYGRQGINKPPSDDHWLMPYWQIGRQLAEAQPQTYEWPKPFSDDEIRAGLQSLIGSAVAQPQDEREAHRIAEELIAIYDSKKPAGGVHGQIVGMEPYIIKANGIALHVLLEAAEMLTSRATPAQDKQDTADDLAWYKEALKRHVEKLESVWNGIREAVQKYSGKPCVGEPFDRLHELLASLSAALPAGSHDKQDAVDVVDTKRLELLAKSDWYVGPSGFYCDEGGGMNDYDDKNKGGIEALRNAIDAMQAQGAKG